VTATECDCEVCRKRKGQQPAVPSPAGEAYTQIRGFDFRVGRLITQVNELGVNRVLVDQEGEGKTIEIFESRQRAIQVFVEVWQHMTPEERYDFWAEIHDDD